MFFSLSILKRRKRSPLKTTSPRSQAAMMREVEKCRAEKLRWESWLWTNHLISTFFFLGKHKKLLFIQFHTYVIHILHIFYTYFIHIYTILYIFIPKVWPSFSIQNWWFNELESSLFERFSNREDWGRSLYGFETIRIQYLEWIHTSSISIPMFRIIWWQLLLQNERKSECNTNPMGGLRGETPPLIRPISPEGFQGPGCLSSVGCCLKLQDLPHGVFVYVCYSGLWYGGKHLIFPAFSGG